jgi:hypothetical protein
VHPEWTLALFTDSSSLPSDVSLLLGRIHADVMPLTFERFRPPSGASRRFRNAFYKLDILNYVGASTEFLLLDSDVVVARDLRETIGTEEVIHLYEPYAAGSPSGGWDLNDRFLGQLAGPDSTPDVRYIGGEFIHLVPLHAPAFLAALAETFEQAREIHQSGFAFDRSDGLGLFDNDEFLLSAAVARLPRTTWSPCRRFRRTHTNYRFQDVLPGDVELSAWHLPGEKRTGLAHLFHVALDESSWFWREDEVGWVRSASRALGLQGRSRAHRLVRTVHARLRERVPSSLQGDSWVDISEGLTA